MAENRERRRFRDSEVRPYAILDEGARMSDPKETLSLEEAERRSRRAVDQLTDLLSRADMSPEKIDDKMYANLNSLFMSLLARRYAIVPPDNVPIDMDSE